MKTTLTALLATALLLAACGSDETETDDAAADNAEGAAAEADPPDTGDSDGDSDSDAADTGDESTGTDDGGGGSAAGGGLAPPGFSLNGFRYCEILMTVPDDSGSPVTEVWGTPGVGPCEDDDWAAIDPEAVLAEFDATWILMNGPRHFTVDGAVDTAPTSANSTEADREVRNFGQVAMTLLATLDEASDGGEPYSPELVARTTTWTFDAGTEGNTYVMQSYALIQDPGRAAEDLATPGDRLDLPDGWSYNARVLDEDLQASLTTDGAIVVQDGFENSYQRT